MLGEMSRVSRRRRCHPFFDFLSVPLVTGIQIFDDAMTALQNRCFIINHQF